MRVVTVVLLALALAACGGAAKRYTFAEVSASIPAATTPGPGGSSFYRHDPPPPSPGCNAEHPHIKPLPRRSAAKPKRPIPFFAARTGALPKDGTATVAGVALPRGSRCAGYWATDEVVDDAATRAAQLAEAFPRTGLWPILWSWGEDPDLYAGKPSDPAAADGLSPLRILRKSDRSIRSLTGGHKLGPVKNPFEEHGAAALILLVPVNRPSQVLSVFGFIGTYIYSDAELTAVAGSFEERYGAIPTEMEPGAVTMVVQRRPTTRAEALRLAREHNAFQPDNGDDPASLVDRLMDIDTWMFGWPD